MESKLNNFLTQQRPERQPASRLLKIYRVVSVLALFLAIAYIVMPYDFDAKGVMGYVDDFFLFMAAFTFMQGSFQRQEMKRPRHLLYQIAAIFFVLAIVWLFVLTQLK